MRSFIIRSLFYLSLAASALASPPQEGHQLNTVEDVLSETKGGPIDAGAKAGATNSEAVSETSTIFNGREVPPMKELNGDNFEKDTRKGYWYGGAAAVDIASIPYGIGLIGVIQVHQALFTFLSALPSNSPDMADPLRILLCWSDLHPVNRLQD